MSKPTVRIHNTETNEIIDREMNDTEYAQYQTDLKTRADELTKINEAATAKANILSRLGITADEAALLLG